MTMMLLVTVAALALATGAVSWAAGNRRAWEEPVNTGSSQLLQSRATRAHLAAMELLGDTHAAAEGHSSMISNEVVQTWQQVRAELEAADADPALVADLAAHFSLVTTFMDVHLESLLDTSGAVGSAARHLADDVSRHSPVLVGRVAAALETPANSGRFSSAA